MLCSVLEDLFRCFEPSIFQFPVHLQSSLLVLSHLFSAFKWHILIRTMSKTFLKMLCTITGSVTILLKAYNFYGLTLLDCNNLALSKGKKCQNISLLLFLFSWNIMIVNTLLQQNSKRTKDGAQAPEACARLII